MSPYIKQEDREKFRPGLEDLKEILEAKQLPKGELTYLVYSQALSYFTGRESYTNISDAISALNDAGEELRRRFLNDYEDKKIDENGDV